MRLRISLVTILVLGLAPLLQAGDSPIESIDQELQAIHDLTAGGTRDEALNRASRLLEGHPDSLAAHIAYQDIRVAQGESKALLDAYEARSNAEEATPDDHFLYGRLLEGKKADLVFRKALRADPAHFWSLCALGANAVADGKYRDAEKFLSSARESDPRSPVPVNTTGWLAESTGDVSRAEECYRKALELNPGYNLSRVNLGILLLGRGRAMDAQLVLDEARKRAPGDPVPLMGLGMARASFGDLDGALGYYKRAVALESNTVASLNLLGSAYLGLGQHELAEEAFNRALEADPQSEATLINLGYLSLQGGEGASARDWFGKALRVNPKNPEAYYFLGLASEREGKTKDAEKAYEKAVDVTDRSVSTVMDLAFVLVGAGQARKAVACFEEVVGVDPNQTTAWMNIGLLYQEQIRDKEKALAAYKEYVLRGGTDERVRVWMDELR